MNNDTVLHYIGTFDEVVQIVINSYSVNEKTAELAVAALLQKQAETEEEDEELKSVFDFISSDKKATSKQYSSKYFLETSKMEMQFIISALTVCLSLIINQSVDYLTLITLILAFIPYVKVIPKYYRCPYFRAICYIQNTGRDSFRVEDILPDDKYGECMYVGRIRSEEWECDKYRSEKCHADREFYTTILNKLCEKGILYLHYDTGLYVFPD